MQSWHVLPELPTLTENRIVNRKWFSGCKTNTAKLATHTHTPNKNTSLWGGWWFQPCWYDCNSSFLFSWPADHRHPPCDASLQLQVLLLKLLQVILLTWEPLASKQKYTANWLGANCNCLVSVTAGVSKSRTSENFKPQNVPIILGKPMDKPCPNLRPFKFPKSSTTNYKLSIYRIYMNTILIVITYIIYTYIDIHT